MSLCRSRYKGMVTGPIFTAAVTVTAIALPLMAWASNGRITFTGAVTESSCAVQVNGSSSGDGVVALPVVDITALDSWSGAESTAAGTFFNIALSGCEPGLPDSSGAVPAGVFIHFEAGPTVDPVTGGLINTGTSNVEVMLYEASGDAIAGSRITPGIAGSGRSASQSVVERGVQYFFAAYSLAAGVVAEPGTVHSSITVSIVYN